MSEQGPAAMVCHALARRRPEPGSAPKYSPLAGQPATSGWRNARHAMQTGADAFPVDWLRRPPSTCRSIADSAGAVSPSVVSHPAGVQRRVPKSETGEQCLTRQMTSDTAGITYGSE